VNLQVSIKTLGLLQAQRSGEKFVHGILIQIGPGGESLHGNRISARHWDGVDALNFQLCKCLRSTCSVYIEKRGRIQGLHPTRITAPPWCGGERLSCQLPATAVVKVGTRMIGCRQKRMFFERFVRVAEHEGDSGNIPAAFPDNLIHHRPGQINS